MRHHALPLAAILGVTISTSAFSADIRFDALTCHFTSAGPKIEGQLTNISSNSMTHVVVYGTFRDAEGKFVSDLDGTPTDFDPVMSNQQTNFSGYGDTNPVIATVEVTAGFIGGAQIESTGMLKADCTQ